MTRIRVQLVLSLLLGALTVLGFAPFYLFPIPLFTLAVLCHLWRGSATIISLGFARLFFRDGHVQRGRHMDLRQPA